MRRRLLFVAGIAVGYIIGARAGRPAYDAVVDRVRGAVGSPTAKRVGEKAKEALEDAAPNAAAVVEQAASTAADVAAAASEAGSAPSDDGSEKSPSAQTQQPSGAKPTDQDA